MGTRIEQTMKTLGIFACLLAVVFAAENTVADEKSSKSAEPVDQLTEEQRYGGYRGGYRGGYGGRRYGRSVADETQELEGQEQRYGGYRGGYRGGMAVAAMVAPSLMRPKSWKDKSRGTADTVDTVVGTVDAAMVVPLPSKYLDKLNLLNDSLRQCILITYVISSFRH